MGLKKNAFYSIILNVSNVLFSFITTPYISRVLGVENVGIVNFAIAYAAYFMIFAMLGVPTYGVRIIASHQSSSIEVRNKLFTELFSLISICSILVSIIYVASIFLIPQLYEQKAFLLVAGITIFLASLNIEWYFSGRERFRTIAIRSIVVKVVMVGAMFIFVRNSNDVMPYMLLSVGALLLNHLWNWIFLLRDGLKLAQWSQLQFKTHIKPLLMLFSATLAISIYTMLDTLMLGFMSTYSEVGYYTSAMKISRVVMPIVTAMSPVIFARVSSMRQEGNFEQIGAVLKNSFSYMYIMAVPITVGLVVIAPRFVPMFFGVAFLPTVVPMQLLSLLVLIIGISNVYGSQTVQAFGYDNQFLITVIIGMVVNFCLNLLFIKPYGAIGASAASVIAEMIVGIMMIYYANKIIRNTPTVKTVISPLVASLPIIVLSWGLNTLNINDVYYFSLIILLSAISYFAIMVFVFKNETLRNITENIINKIKLT